MKLPSNLQSLLRASSSQMVQRMAEAWQCAPSELPEVLLEESRLYLQLDDCDKNSRWLLFELLDRGGAAEVEGFPRIVVQREGEADIRELRDRGLVFVVASGEPPIPYFVLPEELRRGVHHYREQLLLMMLDGQISQLNERSKPTQPFELPPQIKPNMALSQLVASSDPEGFRYPLSRAFAIPDSFPSSIKKVLKQLLHEYYLLLFTALSKLRADRAYRLDHMVRLFATVAAVVAAHYNPMLSGRLLDEDKRPFSASSEILAGHRQGLWRSFMVLLLDQFLTPIGATLLRGNELLINPSGMHPLDLEVKPNTWLVDAQQELSMKR